jgi:hypothetical protein
MERERVDIWKSDGFGYWHLLKAAVGSSQPQIWTRIRRFEVLLWRHRRLVFVRRTFCVWTILGEEIFLKLNLGEWFCVELSWGWECWMGIWSVKGLRWTWMGYNWRGSCCICLRLGTMVHEAQWLMGSLVGLLVMWEDDQLMQVFLRRKWLQGLAWWGINFGPTLEIRFGLGFQSGPIDR